MIQQLVASNFAKNQDSTKHQKRIMLQKKYFEKTEMGAQAAVRGLRPIAPRSGGTECDDGKVSHSFIGLELFILDFATHPYSSTMRH